MKTNFGIPLELTGYSGRIHPDFNHEAVIANLEKGEDLFQIPGGRMLLEGRNRVGVVPLDLPDGTRLDVVVKAFHFRGPDKWKSRFFPSKALRAWRSANSLGEVGIPTPRPIAYFQDSTGGFPKTGFFVYVMQTQVEELRFLFRRLHGAELRKLLSDLAGFLEKAHQRGVLHRDLSDGNILVGKSTGSDWFFFLIDTNRIRVLGKLGMMRGVKNLIRLGVPSSEQEYFLGRYLRVSRVAWATWSWYRIHKNIYSGRIVLKKKLRLRRLAEKLRLQ